MTTCSELFDTCRNISAFQSRCPECFDGLQSELDEIAAAESKVVLALKELAGAVLSVEASLQQFTEWQSFIGAIESIKERWKFG